MARTRRRPRPTQAKTLIPVATRCPECGQRLWATHSKHRTVTTLDTVTRLTLRIRRCPNPDCSRYHRPCHPEAESLVALPHHEFGLDVLALVGRLRHAEHRSVPEIHRELTRRGVAVAMRSVTNLLDRYDELRALATADRERLDALLHKQRRVVLAIDGLQPDVGHEVLWVLRDVLSGEVLLARSLLSATIADLKALLSEVRQALPVPVVAAILRWPGQHSPSHRPGPARGAAPAVPLPLPARGRQTDLRGGPTCEKGAEKTCTWRPRDRTAGREGAERGGGGRA